MSNQIPQYNGLSKIFHWVIAALIFLLLCAGFFMVYADLGALRGQAYMLHKSFGMLVLILAFMRVCWRLLTGDPAQDPGQASWHKNLARIVHILLYIGMIGMPLSGFLMSCGSGYPTSFFGLFEFPCLLAKSESLAHLMGEIHEYTALALIAGIALHTLGAFKNYFLGEDKTLEKMTSERIDTLSVILLGIMTAAFLGTALLLFITEEVLKSAPLPPQTQEAPLLNTQ